MKVQDSFIIDEDFLFYLSEKGGFWKDSYDYYIDVKEKELSELTDDQKYQLRKIESELNR